MRREVHPPTLPNHIMPPIQNAITQCLKQWHLAQAGGSNDLHFSMADNLLHGDAFAHIRLTDPNAVLGLLYAFQDHSYGPRIKLQLMNLNVSFARGIKLDVIQNLLVHLALSHKLQRLTLSLEDTAILSTADLRSQVASNISKVINKMRNGAVTIGNFGELPLQLLDTGAITDMGLIRTILVADGPLMGCSSTLTSLWLDEYSPIVLREIRNIRLPSLRCLGLVCSPPPVPYGTYRYLNDFLANKELAVVYVDFKLSELIAFYKQRQ